MKIVRSAIKNILKLLPGQGRMLKRGYRSIRLKKEVALSRLSRKVVRAHLPDPYSIYWIDPSRIEYHTNKKNSSDDWEDWVFDTKNGLYVPLQDGDWDISQFKTDSMRVFRAIEARIKDGQSWKSTEYYQYALKQIGSGRHVWSCSNQKDFDEHCGSIDRLIESISKRGYLTAQQATKQGEGNASALREVVINIGRNGDCLFQDGRHRLAIARSLRISQIPVQVLVRHEEWQDFRAFLYRMALTNGGASKAGALYQPPRHFDLSDIPSQHACEDRWRVIQLALPAEAGTALDIGCNLGYFCHRLECAGYECIGIEYEPDIALAASRIARSEGRKFRIINSDVLDPAVSLELSEAKFDVIIALNIFHHFIKTADGFSRLEDFIRRVRCRVMFFEPHLPSEPQMNAAFANPVPEDFVRMIQEWGNYGLATPIYTAEDGRTVFRIQQS